VTAGLAVFGVVALLFAIVFGVVGEGAPDLLSDLWPGDLPGRRRRK
jgi:hypothetical protein